MPLEHQWERQHTPLRGLLPRERRIAALVAGLTGGVAALVLVIALLTGGGSSTKPGCVRVTTGGTTGAYVLRSCGADARTFCREEAVRSDGFARTALAACRRSHIAIG